VKTNRNRAVGEQRRIIMRLDFVRAINAKNKKGCTVVGRLPFFLDRSPTANS
jgi:hypothetical protein